jgi:hypothetical protein
MNVKKTVSRGIGAAMTLALVAAGPASASGGVPAGRQAFIVYSAGSSGDDGNTVIGMGPVSGFGRERVLVDHSDETTQDFTTEYDFPAGTVALAIYGPTTSTLDPRSCAGSITGSLRWTITGGTGAYAGASGSGTGTFVDRFVAEQGPDGCSHDEPAVNVFLARLSGSTMLARARAS